MPPSKNDSRPSNPSASSSRLAPIMIGTSWRISWMLTTSGAISALMPRMNSTLKMLLPTTLPMAMSVLPSSTAPTLTATSGALVPKATMVSPTTSGLMPNDRASLDAPRTSTLAPMTSRIRPPRKMSMFMIWNCSYKHSPTAGCSACLRSRASHQTGAALAASRGLPRPSRLGAGRPSLAAATGWRAGTDRHRGGATSQ